MMAKKINPFTPGYGGMPPHLAGREDSQAALADALAALRAGKPGRGIVMYGPRGMGKTVLLNWVQAQCERAGIVATSTTPALGLRSPADLPGLLLDRRAKLEEVSASVWRFLSATWRRDDDANNAVINPLIKACRAQPRVLLFDEAHTLERVELYQALLSVAQIAAAAAPFLLVLAGTPGLMPHLMAINATFVSRSEKIGVGALTEQAAMDAVRVPLEREGIAITADALEFIAADSQQYPFFLQEWGKAVWNHARQQRLTAVTEEHTRAISGDIHAIKEDFYQDRYKTMMDDDALLIAADAVGRVVLAEGGMDFDEVSGVIARELTERMPDSDARSAKARELAQELNRIDYIWNPPKSDRALAGIPSFMAYIRGRVAKRAGRA